MEFGYEIRNMKTQMFWHIKKIGEINDFRNLVLQLKYQGVDKGIIL